MTRPSRFIDTHCHLLPGLDDGARSWDEAIEMARIAESQGTEVILATPQQLGRFRHVRGELIRQRTRQLQELLSEKGIPVRVLPGAEASPDEDLLQQLLRGDVLTLAEQRRHLLVEFPRNGMAAIVSILAPLRRGGIACVLACPERQRILQRHPEQIESLVAQGCLMQIAAGSLLGDFGPAAQQTSEWMLAAHLVHFLATDARGVTQRRPLIRRAFERTCELVGEEMAERIATQNPWRVLSGEPVEHLPPPPRTFRGRRWFPWQRSA